MADILKVLGQSSPAAVTPTELYVTPDLTSTTTSSLVVVNRTAITATFRVSIRVAGAGEDDKQYLFYDPTLEGNSTMTAVIGMTLAESDEVYVYASSTGLSFTLFGVETK